MSSGRFNPLNAEESVAFQAIGSLLESLPETSQYKLLAQIAKVYDREIVRPGAVRAAAATAAAISRAQVPTDSVNRLKKSKTSKKAKNTDPMFDSWCSSAGRPLIEARNAFKASHTGPLSEEAREELSSRSRDIRVAYDLFRSSQSG